MKQSVSSVYAKDEAVAARLNEIAPQGIRFKAYKFVLRQVPQSGVFVEYNIQSDKVSAFRIHPGKDTFSISTRQRDLGISPDTSPDTDFGIQPLDTEHLKLALSKHGYKVD